MERVRVISTSTLQPATYTPHSTPQKIHLTPWDLQFLLVGAIQKGILFTYSPHDLLHLLKISLSRALDYFYPLAGRLACAEDVAKDAKRYYVECNNEGVEFVHAVGDGVTVSDILKPEYDFDIIHRLFSQNELLNIECDVKPFLTVQVTELAGGGCFIGCTLSHMFSDGASFWHLFNSWSEICRGSAGCCLSNPPVLDRQLFPHQAQVWIPNKKLTVKKPAARNKPTSNLRERMFHFPRQKITSLKHKAGVGQSGNNEKISSLQAVLAYIWRAVTSHRPVQGDDDLHLNMGIGDRTRTAPALPAHYLGNAIRLVKCSMKGEEILQGKDSLGRVAWQLNTLVASQTCTLVMDFIDSWIENPRLLLLESVISVNSLGTSSSPRFNVYGNDFGWGRPVAVRSGGANKPGGKLTLFPGAEDGSMDVEICLQAETLEALERDGEFMDGIY
uniref:Uncharacterized protein n=1 Tax=Kalanchoe fedtschenkoi TaxID=63787 RepID=A0A7N0V894_KALFE